MATPTSRGGGDVDDAAEAAVAHRWERKACRMECRRQVDREDRIPFSTGNASIWCDMLDPGVVHEDVDAAEIGRASRSRVDDLDPARDSAPNGGSDANKRARSRCAPLRYPPSGRSRSAISAPASARAAASRGRCRSSSRSPARPFRPACETFRRRAPSLRYSWLSFPSADVPVPLSSGREQRASVGASTEISDGYRLHAVALWRRRRVAALTLRRGRDRRRRGDRKKQTRACAPFASR